MLHNNSHSNDNIGLYFCILRFLDDISTGADKDYLKTLQGFLSFSNTVTGDVISFTTSGMSKF